MTEPAPMPPEADFCGLTIPDQPPDDETVPTDTEDDGR